MSLKSLNLECILEDLNLVHDTGIKGQRLADVSYLICRAFNCDTAIRM